MHPLLEIKNLHIDFVQDEISVPAVKDISFTITKGKLTAIVGESGSGKSVTALSVLKLLPKQANVLNFFLAGGHLCSSPRYIDYEHFGLLERSGWRRRCSFYF